MTAYGRQIVVLAGEPSSTSRDPSELSLVYILDTSKIRYPNDQQIQQTPAGERVPGNRLPSNERSTPTQARPGQESRNESRTGRRPSPEGLRRNASASRESMAAAAGPPGGQTMGLPPMNGPGMNGLGMNGAANRSQDPAVMSGVPQQGSGARMPRASMAQAPSGPPPQQQAPPPRVNGVAPPFPGQGPRSRTPTRDPRAYGPPIDTQRLDNVEADHNSSMNREPPGPGPKEPQERSFSPMGNPRGVPVQHQQQQQQQQTPFRPTNRIPGADEPPIHGGPRSRSQSNTRQEPLDEIDEFPTANASKPIQQQIQQQQAPPIQQGPKPYGQSNEQSYPEEQLRNSPSPAQAQQQSKFDELIGQQDDLIRELEESRTKNHWYASELELARKQGFQQSPSRGIDLSDTSAVDLDEDDKPLLEALVAMRAQLAEVQGTVDSRIEAAAQQVAEVEQQRDTAIREAVYAKARLAAQGGSHTGTPQSDGASRDMGIDDRSSDIGRKLAAALATQTELRSSIEALKAEMESERQAREMAEGTAEAAQKRIAEFNESYNPGELESLRMELHEVSKVARDESALRTELQSQKEFLKGEKEDLAKRLEEALENAQQHSVTFASMREAVSSSTDKTNMLERKLEEERRQREHLDAKLMQLRSAHEERTAELESTSKRLRDAEELAETHANEASTHRQAMLAGLEKISKQTPQPRSRGISDDRVTTLKQQVEQAHALMRKNQADADEAAEKLRAAEGRIAGLEAYQEQSSRESLSVRQQLQRTVKESQALQAKHKTLLQNFESHQRDASALSVQHSALKDLIDERNSEKSRQRSLDSEAEQTRAQELEQQLRASIAAHAETRSDAEAREQEAERSYQNKLDQLGSELRDAISYVKHVDAHVTRMNEKNAKLKSINGSLQKQLEESERERGNVLDPSAAAEWEAERAQLRNEISEMQESVKESVAALEKQMTDMQGELSVAQQDRDRFRAAHEQSQRQFSQVSEASAREFEQLQRENGMLEEKLSVVQARNDKLLQSVTESMNTYKRQSQNLSLLNGISASHSRNLSNSNNLAGMRPSALDTASNPMGTTSSDNPPQLTSPVAGNGRSDFALEQFQSELDAIRTQWEGSRSAHNNRPLSSNFDMSEQHPHHLTNPSSNSNSTPTGPVGHHARDDSFESHTSGMTTGTTGSSSTNNAPIALPEGAKGWRQRLELAERERELERARSETPRRGDGVGGNDRGSSPIVGDGSAGGNHGGNGARGMGMGTGSGISKSNSRRSMPGALEDDDDDDDSSDYDDEPSMQGQQQQSYSLPLQAQSQQQQQQQQRMHI